MNFKKRAIPQAVRRAVAGRAGGRPLCTSVARCAYCDATGTIHWKTPSWVYFQGLELDHVVPEVSGGPTDADNIVLACRRCNRSRGHRAIGQPKAGRS